MSKSLDTEYTNLVTEDIPDLWARIESGLSERTPSKNIDATATAVADISQKKARSFKRYIPIITAAAIVTVVIVPVAAAGVLTVAIRSIKSSNQSTMTTSNLYETDNMFEAAEEATMAEMAEEAPMMEEAAKEAHMANEEGEEIMAEEASQDRYDSAPDYDAQGNGSKNIDQTQSFLGDTPMINTKPNSNISNGKTENNETEAVDNDEQYKQSIYNGCKKIDTFSECRVEISFINENNGSMFACVEILEDNDFAKSNSLNSVVVGLLQPNGIEPDMGEEYICTIEKYQDEKQNVFYEIILESSVRSEE